MITGIERVSTGLDRSFNTHVINKLRTSPNWIISNDEDEVTVYSEHPKDAICDSGFLNLTYDIARPNDINKHFMELNVLAEVILSTVISKQQKFKFHNISIQRYLWNYYNRSSCGAPHWDGVSGNLCSIVYYLNTCDAYTIFDDKHFECIMGDSLIFNSILIHKGTGPSLSRNKFCLNIMFKYDVVEGK